MCGIAGILVAPGDRAEAGPGSAVLRMAEALHHRGPDARTSWVEPDGRCAFGHARLRVVDLETGSQPMSAADGRATVVFNGEIYNHLDLRAELERAGTRFRTRSDTEILLAGWRAWGPGLVERLEGMFAFAVWDAGEGRLFLARDRTGQKPLFLWRDGRRLVFASEPAALRAAGLPTRVRDASVQLYLAHGYVPGPETIFEDVTQLGPGERALVRQGESPRIDEWWRLDWTPTEMSRAEAVAGVRSRMVAAVEKRLMADVPLGALLSGGVDSSLVVGLMSGAMDRPVDTFAMGFEGAPNFDETKWARRMAERFGANHHEFRVAPDTDDLVDRMVEAYGEPFGDSSAIALGEVCRHTAGAVTVALSGDGGDELFVGYPRFFGAALAARIPRPLARLGRFAADLLPWTDDFRHPFRRARRFFDRPEADEAERMLRWVGFLTLPPEEVTPEARRVLRDAQAISEPFRRIVAEVEELDPLRRALHLNWRSYLPGDLLPKADRASMMHSLELRAPFLDHELAEFVARIPNRHLVPGNRPKALLREAFSDLVPAEVFDRPKMGFGVPIAEWFRGSWRSRFEAEVLSDDARSGEWVRRPAVERTWREHLSGRADHAHGLWALFTLETWLRRWL